jgi:phenylacetate-CoA ligase
MRPSLKDFTQYHLRFNPYFRAQLRRVLDQKQWDDERLRQQQNERFLHLFRQAVRHSKFYQRHYAEHGVDTVSIKSVADLPRLPVVTREHIREHLRDIIIGQPWLKTVGRTSGSSGTPLTIYRDYRSTVREGAYLWAQRALFGLHPGMKVVSLRGNLDRRVMHHYDHHARCLHLSSFNLREEQADWYYEQIRQFDPYAILAYPSSVEILANLLKAKGRALSVPYIFTSSEQLYEHQRAKVEAAFKTHIVDWYGNAERTIALEQRPDGDYHTLPLYSVNEYRTDHVLTTGLITAAFPLIRYRVDDVIVPYPDQAHQIQSIQGRHDDVLRLPDGTRVGRIGGVFLNVVGLELAQIRQGADGRVLINLVVNKSFSAQSVATIQTELLHRIGDSLPYKIAYVPPEAIVRTATGKFKLVISDPPASSPEARP